MFGWEPPIIGSKMGGYINIKQINNKWQMISGE